jgi:hypothetical protein
VLEGLDDVDWKSLHHAYGTAEDVPQQIRDLRSRRKKKREKAGWELFGNIFHQGTRYEASAHAIPFLVEVAVALDTPARDQVLALIAALAIGYDEEWLPQGISISALRSEVAALEGDDSEYGQWALNAYDAVREQLPVLRPLLDDDSPAVRMWTAYVLSWFPEEAATSLPTIFARAGSEQSRGPAAAAIVALGLLGAPDDAELIAWLEREAAGDDRARRWAAATALARLTPASPSARLDELARTAGGDEPDLDGERLPFFSGDLAGYAAASLTLLPAAASERAVDGLLAHLRTTSFTDALHLGDALLNIAFPEGPIPPDTPFSALTSLQQRVVRGLADAPSAWMIDDAIFANFSSMVGGYGLPADLDAIRTYTSR